MAAQSAPTEEAYGAAAQDNPATARLVAPEPAPHEILAPLLTHMAQGAIVIGSDDRLVLCNERAARALGWALPVTPGDHDRAALDARESAIGLGRAGARRHASRHLLPGGYELRLYSDPDWLRRPVDRDRLDAGDGDSLFRNSVIGVYRSSIDGKQVRANPALVRLNGLESEEELIATVEDIGNEWYVDPGRRAEFKRLMDMHGEVTDFVSEVITTGSRRRIWVSENAWVVRDAQGNPAFYEGTVVEASQRIRDEARNAHLARHDGLTGLANRTYFSEQLRGFLQAVQQAQRDEGGIALVCVDLDRFKDVNDTLGHEAGDALLRALGERLAEAAGGCDRAGRLGGDEFALILDQIDDGEALEQRLDRLIDALRAPLSLVGRDYHPSVSIGAAIGPRDGVEVDDLYRSADAALYAVKGKGRDAWRVFDGDLRRQALRQRSLARSLEALLRGADPRGSDPGENGTTNRAEMRPESLQLAYTPFIATADGRHAGFSATPVWHHPEGEVSGRDLLEIAEASNLAGNLFERILADAIAMRHRLVAAGHEPGLFSLPVSAAVLREPQRPAGIEQALREADILPVHFELALPEQALHDRSADTIRDALAQLSEAGMRVALEDFGSGHASLTQLRRFPVDLVRMGEPLIASIDRPGAEADLPQTILALARGFGLYGAASGVGRQSQFDQLARWGCDYVLGDLVSPRLERDGAVMAYLAARAALIGNADAFLV